MDLKELGWTDTFAQSFVALNADGAVPGRIALEHTHIYRVLTDDSGMAGARLGQASSPGRRSD